MIPLEITRMNFKLESPFQPTGDQPTAIEQLVKGTQQGKPHQTLLGVTGSGKTFTIANLIQQTQKPTLIISHNKTLAAQLYQEFRDFFPSNAVSYFVSYYDYYQPEAYIPQTDTYIEKETDINDEIDKLRLSTTTNLLTRPDVIVVASVSCIYNLGSPIEYGRYILEIIEGQIVSRQSILARLLDLQYDRSDYDLSRGTFRARGDILQIWPAYEDHVIRLQMLDNKIEKISLTDPITGKPLPQSGVYAGKPAKPQRFVIYPAKHYLTNPTTQAESIKAIKADLTKRLEYYKQNNQVVEAYRLEQKVTYDLEQIQEFGFVNGIENYSRYFDGRKPGDPPFTLIDYFHENVRLFSAQPPQNQTNTHLTPSASNSFLTIIDESHITVPQIRGMYRGDQSRKQTLIDYGFRLPSALDNRPLRYEEFARRIPQTIYTSATPNQYEISQSGNRVIEQLIRPTALIDPEIEVRPTEGQIENLTKEIIIRKQKGQRVLVTTLTKRMAEVLTDYLNDKEKLNQLLSKSEIRNPKSETNSKSQTPSTREGSKKTLSNFVLRASNVPKVQYLHSDVATLDRSDILDSLRKGDYDVLVGINLLREGLDLPEVSLVAILDADKQGFLRSTTSLVQVMGRAARHQDGQVIMYADKITDSMQAAIDEVNRRRDIQQKYNKKHDLTPTSITKPIRTQLIARDTETEAISASAIQLSKNQSINLDQVKPDALTPQDKQKLVRSLTRRMNRAARDLDFELAARLRDTIETLR